MKYNMFFVKTLLLSFIIYKYEISYTYTYCILIFNQIFTRNDRYYVSPTNVVCACLITVNMNPGKYSIIIKITWSRYIVRMRHWTRIRSIHAYQNMVSYNAAAILARMLPIDMLADKRTQLFKTR